jgi:NADH dehydrogenase FAD-containing subunit
MAHHVVIVGAGFGGLAAAHGLAGADVKITIVDQRNHHLFQPLLYQVGTASLATSEIAWPIRHLVRKRKEITTLLGTVQGVDTQKRRVQLDDGGMPISATTNGSRSRRVSKLWKMPPRYAAEFCCLLNAPNARPTRRAALRC